MNSIPVTWRTESWREFDVWQGDYDRGYLYECEFVDDKLKEKLPRDQLYQPTRVIPIHNTNDKPVTYVHFGLVYTVYIVIIIFFTKFLIRY